MQKLFKRLVALLLCGSLIYNSLGVYWALSCVQITMQQCKWAGLEKLPLSVFEKISVDKNSAKTKLKILNKHEVIINGCLYDIVHKSETSTKFIFYALRDKAEEKLLAHFRTFQAANQNAAQKHTVWLILDHIIKTALINPTAHFLAFNIHFIDYKQYTFLFSTIYHYIFSPPPEC